MTETELLAALSTAGWDVVDNTTEYTEDGYERHKVTALKITGDIIERRFFHYYVESSVAYWLGNDPLTAVTDNVTPTLDAWVAAETDQVAYVIENLNLPDTAIAWLFEESGSNATEERALVYRNSSATMEIRKIA